VLVLSTSLQVICAHARLETHTSNVVADVADVADVHRCTSPCLGHSQVVALHNASCAATTTQLVTDMAARLKERLP
jgi:hypothetical protein